MVYLEKTLSGKILSNKALNLTANPLALFGGSLAPTLRLSKKFMIYA